MSSERDEEMPEADVEVQEDRPVAIDDAISSFEIELDKISAPNRAKSNKCKCTPPRSHALDQKASA